VPRTRAVKMRQGGADHDGRLSRAADGVTERSGASSRTGRRVSLARAACEGEQHRVWLAIGARQTNVRVWCNAGGAPRRVGPVAAQPCGSHFAVGHPVLEACGCSVRLRRGMTKLKTGSANSCRGCRIFRGRLPSHAGGVSHDSRAIDTGCRGASHAPGQSRTTCEVVSMGGGWHGRMCSAVSYDGRRPSGTGNRVSYDWPRPSGTGNDP